MDDQNSEGYLSISEAAVYLGVSPKTLRRWDAAGKLPSVRRPGSGYRYYRRADLEPFRLEYKRAEQAPPRGRHLFETAHADIEDNQRLREPQQEAYRHVREHFAQSETPAILQIPVGCGKTGVIATLPFGIASGRVLVIAPNLTIRREVADALDLTSAKCFWTKTLVLLDFTHGPYRAVLDGPNANIHDCTESHFVVTNIQQLASSADRWLPQFPPGFFDMILIDEAHHNPAESWRKVLERFPEAKVISLTATPFRSDGKALVGNVIYRYSYTQAMMKGYIKQITSRNIAPKEIYFTYRDDERRHTLEEVLELREEAWFRRGVALAPECNAHIVDASVKRCLALRERTRFKHQIIAAACSVDHARQVRSLYEQRGMEAREIHSDMPSEDRDRVLAELRAGQLDCVVQVQMLGEGFDHPPLSVAAIFRPFRSLSPYIQFIGRIMRVNHQNEPDHPDNQGFVISHVGLSNDANWFDFREVDLDDQRIFHQWLTDPGTDEPEDEGEGTPRRFDTGMRVQDEIVSHFIDQAFLNPHDDRVIDRILSQTIPGTSMRVSELVSPEDLRRRLLERQQQLDLETPEAIPVQPQRRRQAARKRLNERENSVINRILSDLGLAVAGRDVGRVIPAVRRLNNRSAVTKLFKAAVNARLGIERKQRNAPSAAELEHVLERLDDIGDSVRDDIRQQLKEAADAEGP